MYLKLNITNKFTDQLPGDPIQENSRRQVTEAAFSFVKPIKTSNPRLLHVSSEMSKELGFSNQDIQSNQFLDVMTGNSIIENSKPFAMCYAGHQFGNWAGQLGDGRAINLGEIKNWALQLKGPILKLLIKMEMSKEYFGFQHTPKNCFSRTNALVFSYREKLNQSYFL